MLARGFSHFLCLRNGINHSLQHGICSFTSALIFTTSKRCSESEVIFFLPSRSSYYISITFYFNGHWLPIMFQCGFRCYHDPYLQNVKTQILCNFYLKQYCSVWKKKNPNINTQIYNVAVFSPHSYNLSQHVRKNLSTFIEKTFACGPYAFGSLARLTFFSLSAKTCAMKENCIPLCLL